MIESTVSALTGDTTRLIILSEIIYSQKIVINFSSLISTSKSAPPVTSPASAPATTTESAARTATAPANGKRARTPRATQSAKTLAASASTTPTTAPARTRAACAAVAANDSAVALLDPAAVEETATW